MIAFICLFLPAVLTVWLYEYMSKRDLTVKQWLYRYCASNLFVNVMCFAVKRFVTGTAGNVFASLMSDVTPAAALNYMVMAIPFAIIGAFMQVLLSKHAVITVEAEEV